MRSAATCLGVFAGQGGKRVGAAAWPGSVPAERLAGAALARRGRVAAWRFVVWWDLAAWWVFEFAIRGAVSDARSVRVFRFGRRGGRRGRASSHGSIVERGGLAEDQLGDGVNGRQHRFEKNRIEHGHTLAGVVAWRLVARWLSF